MKGINFNDTHSYYDLNLILSECSISPATPKTNYINIPGADGSIDLTEALGDVKYNDRKGSLVFSVLPSDDFEEKKSEISNFLNGKHFDKITLDKDPDWYYIGRCTVNDYKSDKMQRQISVDLVLQPYKIKNKETVKVVKNKNGFASQSYVLTNARMPAIPTLTFEYDDSYIELNGVIGTYPAGTYRMPEACLYEGETVLVYRSSGTLTITYQEGSL
jgi:phage-related protein